MCTNVSTPDHPAQMARLLTIPRHGYTRGRHETEMCCPSFEEATLLFVMQGGLLFVTFTCKPLDQLLTLLEGAHLKTACHFRLYKILQFTTGDST